MGVPKFFRYTSERYPCLNELVKQYQIPDFDNMYLDMNGIIHNCSHPDDSNPHFRITEEKIFQDIFHYLSILFQIIKPKKLFFMAIDGVAPRAKMNQQRGRRFRSAREAEKLEEEAKSKGEVLPTEKRFDSNCITPGTVFMARLHEQLRYFVKHKISTDPLWSKVKVILSGHETPGEGEHKIMDYIRWARSQPDYEPNTRHCLYGLDADLIMLGMCTHEPHFALLREEVKFGKTTQRATSPEETNFYLLHLSLMRQYLEQEFILLKDKLPFEYDLEKVVDDWVLMGFLVGNDFIPNLPNMHISNDALPILYKTYMDVLPTLDGYINEAGVLNLKRFETFMQELAKIDKEKFQDTYMDLKYFESKTGRRPNDRERKEYKPNNDDTFNVDLDDIKANQPDDELQALINATRDMYVDDIDIGDDDDAEDLDTSDEESNFNLEFALHKKDYYMNKLDYSKVTDEVLASQAEGYVRAIQWNLHYYYRGCPSWCWYYPHHYAPYISDIKGFSHLDFKFEKGEPFKPFEQLLAVLPAASKHLLPTPFHTLMTDEDSPIVHYYPINFETDLNGKKNDWEAVVLIPFIDEVNLLSAMAPCYQRLTDEERKRNSHGPMLVYNWTKDNLGADRAPEYFPPIRECHATELRVFREDIDVPLEKLKQGMLPNTQKHMLFPGFPTMRHLKYTTSLKKCKVKVFDQPSRNENMIVQLVRDVDKDPPLDQVAQNILGKVIWVGWPHLTRAKVISVSNEKERLHFIENMNRNSMPAYTTEKNAGNMHKQWIMERSTVIEHNMNRLGIELGDVNTIVHAVNLKGYKYIVQDNMKMALEPEFCSNPCGYAYQAIVTDVKAYIMDTAHQFSTPNEAYPVGDNVFMMTQGQYYGCIATVTDSESIRSGRIKISVLDKPQPVPVAPSNSCQYRNAHHAAASIGISTQLLSRITGCIFVVPGERNNNPTEGVNKTNIGVNVKFNKKNQEVSGYTRRCPVTDTWLYSDRCVQLVAEYSRAFPDLFNRLAVSMNNDVFYEGQLWPGEVGKNKVQEVQNWLKAQSHTKALRRECGSEALEPEELKALASSIDSQLEELKAQEKRVSLLVKWNLLYKPELHQGNITPDPKADFKMFDRIVCVAKNITVPFGAEGTITAIYKPGQSNTVRLSDKLNQDNSYQVLFDYPFPGAMKEELFDDLRFYRMLPTFMMNISYGRKLRDAVIKAQPAEAFTFNHKPNILRREDGHHSAFANYSPTSDERSPVPVLAQMPGPSVATKVPTSYAEDTSTEALKNLLKISDYSNDKKPAKVNKNPNPPTEPKDKNWRAKKDDGLLPTPSQRPPQQNNWRKENQQKPNKMPQPPPPPTAFGEWMNRNYKAQPPPSMPPFPSFPQSQSFPGPGIGQIPLPQFQNVNQVRKPNPPFGQPHGNQFGNPRSKKQEVNGQFPQHLPNVSGMGSVPAKKTEPSSKKLSNANIDKLINPFVPLQVQASQRRTSNPTGPSNMRQEPPEMEAAKPTVTHAKPQSDQKPSQDQSTSGKPASQRKRRPRIAANLPFQHEE